MLSFPVPLPTEGFRGVVFRDRLTEIGYLGRMLVLLAIEFLMDLSIPALRLLRVGEYQVLVRSQREDDESALGQRVDLLFLLALQFQFQHFARPQQNQRSQRSRL